MQLLNGIAILTSGEPVTGLPDRFTELGTGTVAGVPIPFLALTVTVRHSNSLGLP